MAFAWLMKLYHAAWHPGRPDWDSDIPFQSFFLMDDQVLVECDLGRRAFTSVAIADECASLALGDEARNVEKDEEEGGLEQQQIIWGLLYDTIRMTVSIPRVKVEKAYYLLFLPDFNRGCRGLSQALVQELRGCQQFWSWIKKTLKPLFGATDELLAGVDSRGFAVPRGGPSRQTRVWEEFWDAIQLQRILVQKESFWEARFTDGLEHLLSVRERLALPGASERVVWVTADATPDRVGAIDWTNSIGAEEDMGPVFEPLARALKDSLGGSVEEDEEGRCDPLGAGNYDDLII